MKPTTGRMGLLRALRVAVVSAALAARRDVPASFASAFAGPARIPESNRRPADGGRRPPPSPPPSSSDVGEAAGPSSPSSSSSFRPLDDASSPAQVPSSASAAGAVPRRPPALSSRGLPPVDPALSSASFGRPSARTFRGPPIPPSARMTEKSAAATRRGASARSVALDPSGGRTRRWLDRLASASNAASLLCVVDCTLLPVATVVLPLLGVAAGPAGTELLHSIGHSVAMLFVLPVGALAAATNYLSHRRPMATLPAFVGLGLVYLANASHGMPLLSYLPHDLAHSLHCGTALHRAANISGCAMLLASNFLSRRLSAGDGACVGGRFCDRADCRTEEGRGESFFRWERS